MPYLQAGELWAIVVLYVLLMVAVMRRQERAACHRDGRLAIVTRGS
jgi:hypothetical protein